MTLVWGGLALGAIYALVAIGYNIVYLSAKTFNFAHAQLLMLGVFVTYTCLMEWRLPWLLVIVLAAAAVAVVAAIENLVAVRPVKDVHNILVTTLGASTFLDGTVSLIWGNQPLAVSFPLGGNAIDLLGGRVYPIEPILILLVIVIVLADFWISRRFLVGLALRAMSEDPEAAQLRGVNIRAMAFGAFVAAGALAGAAAVFVGPKTFAVSTLGDSLALKGFVALAIGGFGSMPGALVGGAAVGLVEILAARYLGGEYSNPMIFVMLLTVFIIRPAGLFVHSSERTV
ncbi:MAG: branched-chain amino acid ABC transporter permease [Nitratireductor sp.]|nr:branched-chain amino acid ABC transporter permease [Nitratireductor sp.]